MILITFECTLYTQSIKGKMCLAAGDKDKLTSIVTYAISENYD